MTAEKKRTFADKKMFSRAIVDSFVKLKSGIQAKNPVMLLVYLHPCDAMIL